MRVFLKNSEISQFICPRFQGAEWRKQDAFSMFPFRNPAPARPACPVSKAESDFRNECVP